MDINLELFEHLPKRSGVPVPPRPLHEHRLDLGDQNPFFLPFARGQQQQRHDNMDDE